MKRTQKNTNIMKTVEEEEKEEKIKYVSTALKQFFSQLE